MVSCRGPPQNTGPQAIACPIATPLHLHHAYASVPPLTNRMSIAASEGEPYLSGDDDQDALPPSGVVALSKPDPEMTPMLSWAAENVGLMVVLAPLQCHY